MTIDIGVSTYVTLWLLPTLSLPHVAVAVQSWHWPSMSCRHCPVILSPWHSPSASYHRYRSRCSRSRCRRGPCVSPLVISSSFNHGVDQAHYLVVVAFSRFSTRSEKVQIEYVSRLVEYVPVVIVVLHHCCPEKDLRQKQASQGG